MPPTTTRRARRIAPLGLAALCVLWGGGCGQEYDQSSPEAVIASARLMVERGEAEELQRLIYAETPEMRRLLEQVGGLLQSLHELGQEVRRTYPEEIEKLRAEAAEAAKNGQASGFLSRMTGMAASQRTRRGRDPAEQRRAFDMAMKELFADPYGWLERGADRLGVEPISDDMAAVLVDGKPVLPPIGLVMREENGRWYLVLPTNLPGVSSVVPRTPEGYEIAGSLVAVFENTLDDLRKDVREGKAKSLDDLAGLAGEKAFLPVALAAVAYGKAMEEARKQGGK